MKLTNYIKKALTGLYSSLRRVPVTIALSAATAAMLIIVNELDPTASRAVIDMLKRIAMAIALGIPLSLCIKHGFERRSSGGTAALAVVHAAGAALLVLYYFFLLPDFKMVSITRYIAVSMALYITFVLLPYLYKRENFELYVMKLFIRFWVTALYSGVLFAGMSAILFTIDRLLQVHVDGKMYYYVWLVIAGVFASSFFLAGIPAFGQKLEREDYSKLLKILLLYIVMPLISAYTVILYIYFAKIIITLSWPQGLVAHLTLWYAVISAAVIFLTSPLAGVNKWVRMFIFWYTKLVLPILAIMFISIGIRINSYGVTENRYFVVILGLWVTGLMIYLNIAKNRRNIIMPVSLAVIAVLSVFGPWSAYSVSKLSQNMRFESILTKNDMIRDGLIARPAGAVSENDKIELSEILLYFSNNHSLKDLKHLPADFKLENMESTVGFPVQQRGYAPGTDGYISYNLGSFNKPVELKGYDYLFEFGTYKPETAIKSDSLEVRYNTGDTDFKVLVDDKEIYTKDLGSYAKQLHEKFKNDYNQQRSLEEMTFTDSNDRVDVKFIIRNVYGREDLQTGKVTLDGIEFYALVRVK